MNVSFDFDAYLEHKPFFDEMAISMQKNGNKVGIITGERDKDVYTGADLKTGMVAQLGFTPDFMHLWGQNEAIANGALWKCQKLDQEDVYAHFDDDAPELKRYTDRWILKVMLSGDPSKF